MQPSHLTFHRARLRTGRAAVAIAASLLVGSGLVATAPAGAATQGRNQWSVEEQQFVYELNQARWAPTGVLAAAGLPAGTVLPAPPLAVSNALAAAAGFRSDEMADYDYFAHRSPVTGDWPNAVARQFGYPLPATWPDAANSIESIHRGSPRIGGVLLSFVGSDGHRNHLMGQGFYAYHREIGVGARLDERTWSVLTATTGSGDLFITGVTYSDANGNGRMDLGEGLAGVTVSVGSATTTTNAGGGWALAVAPGAYRVGASGGPFGDAVTARVRVRKFNVGVDFVSLDSGPRSAATAKAEVFSYQRCFGLVPTILGTSGDDVITGTPGDDVIVGGAGNDTIRGGGGNDTICGGAGRDWIDGGSGRDRISGGPGMRDHCVGGERTKACELP